MINLICCPGITDKKTHCSNGWRRIIDVFAFKNDLELPITLISIQFNVINIDKTVFETGTAVAGPDVVFPISGGQPVRPACTIFEPHLDFEG